MTIVVVTHELSSVELIADRIAMLHEGKVIACGPLKTVKESSDPLIRQFFNREPDEEKIDAEKYLSSLFE